MTLRSNGPPEQWPFGAMALRSNDPPRPMILRSTDPLDQRTVTVTTNGCWISVASLFLTILFLIQFCFFYSPLIRVPSAISAITRTALRGSAPNRSMTTSPAVTGYGTRQMSHGPMKTLRNYWQNLRQCCFTCKWRCLNLLTKMFTKYYSSFLT